MILGVGVGVPGVGVRWGARTVDVTLLVNGVLGLFDIEAELR